MRVVGAGAALECLLPAMHFRRRLLETDIALQLLGFIPAALVAQLEVLGQRVVFVRQVRTVLDVRLAVELVCAAAVALETVLALPLLRNVLDLRRQAERMVRSIASSAEHQQVFFSCSAAHLACLAVEAPPV